MWLSYASFEQASWQTYISSVQTIFLNNEVHDIKGFKGHEEH